jgi:hypothetical protein
MRPIFKFTFEKTTINDPRNNENNYPRRDSVQHHARYVDLAIVGAVIVILLLVSKFE